jgi:hypothetical protein
MVLDPAVATGAHTFDRNSYDLVRPPLASAADRKAVARSLSGNWDDAIPMLTAKVLPRLTQPNRLTTPGQVSDAILRDEDFAEVHLHKTVRPEDVEEVRVPVEDVALETNILDHARAGIVPTPDELVWIKRREAVREQLKKSKLREVVVTSTGRGTRWR